MTPTPAAGRASTALVFERDGHRCLHCGTGDQLSPQHRRNRGMGGTSAAALHAPSNVVTLCWPANSAMESDAAAAAEGRRYGWKLDRDQDPAATPVYDAAAGLWYLLRDDYGRDHVVVLEVRP